MKVVENLTRQLAATRSRRLSKALEPLEAGYQEPWDDREAAGWQLARWNRLWPVIRAQVPYWNGRSGLPDRFSSWEEFASLIEPQPRCRIQQSTERFQRQDLRSCGRRSTGGSTGEPLQFPVCRQEVRVSQLNLWLGRRRFGIHPDSRLFLIWGHSHTLEPNLRGKFTKWWRSAADSALGYCRWSAYDLSDTALRAAGKTILQLRPDYLLGYSVGLDRLAAANQDRAAQFRELKLRAAIATAESFPHPGSAQQVGHVLGCPVVMEYGTVETGPIAYGLHGQPQAVFWRDFYLETTPFSGNPNRLELLVTALYPRMLPLIRYRLGDLVDTPLGPPGHPRLMGAVRGRCNDFVELSDGTLVHSEAFTHAIKAVQAVRQFQVHLGAAGEVQIHYLASKELNSDDARLIQTRLGKIHPELASAGLRKREQLQQTAAGKTSMIFKAVR